MIGTKKITHWVQCERKNCGKWRKVPNHINEKELPKVSFSNFCLLQTAN